MGATWDQYDFGVIKKESLSKAIKDLKNDRLHEYGHDDYAGHLGLNTHSISDGRVFGSLDEATEYIEDNAKKGHCLVVPYRKSKVLPETAKSKRLGEKNAALVKVINQYKSDIKEMKGAFLQRAKAAKSKNRGCKECGSMISTQHINSLLCPVCKSDGFIITETDSKRLAGINARKVKAENELAEIKKSKGEEKQLRTKETDEIAWVIAGWCYS